MDGSYIVICVLLVLYYISVINGFGVGKTLWLSLYEFDFEVIGLVEVWCLYIIYEKRTLMPVEVVIIKKNKIDIQSFFNKYCKGKWHGYRTFSCFSDGFVEVRLLTWHPYYCLSRAFNGNSTFVAVKAAVVHDLEIERAVAKSRAPFHAFSTTDTQFFIDFVLEIRLFHEFAFQCTGWADLILSGGVEV